MAVRSSCLPARVSFNTNRLDPGRPIRAPPDCKQRAPAEHLLDQGARGLGRERLAAPAERREAVGPQRVDQRRLKGDQVALGSREGQAPALGPMLEWESRAVMPRWG